MLRLLSGKGGLGQHDPSPLTRSFFLKGKNLPFCRLERGQNLSDFVEIRKILRSGGLLAVANQARFIDHKCRSCGGVANPSQGWKQNVVGLGDFFVEVADESDFDAFLFGPGVLRERAVHTDSHDIRIEVGVFLEAGREIAEFLGADAGEGEGEEKEKRWLAAEMGREREVAHVRCF